MQQRVTIATVAGRAGKWVAAKFRKWADERIPEPTPPEVVSMSADEWPLSSRLEMRQLVTELRSNCQQLPVVFFAEYLDRWSSGDVFDIFPSDRARLYNVMSNEADMYCYLLPDAGLLGGQIAKDLRRKHMRERNPAETRWLYTFLQEAYLAWDSVACDSVIVLTREPFAGSVEDEEVIASTASVPAWMTAIDETDWVRAAQSIRDPGPGHGRSRIDSSGF